MAGRDLTVLIPAGERRDLQAPGEFIFLKAADRVVNVLISEGQHTGTRVLMQVGDKYRPGNFKAFVVENPDPVNPARVTFTVGEGDYQTQTIKGELNVVPSIIKADGTVKADDRFYVDLNVSPSQQFTTLNVDAGEIITRQLLYTEASESDQDYPVSGGFADGVLIGRDAVINPGSIDLGFFTLAGELQEIRTLNFPTALRFLRPKTIADIDGEYFFLSGQDDHDLDNTQGWSVVLCRWFGGNATVVGSGPIFHSEANSAFSDGWRVGVGLHYDQDTKTLWMAYKDWTDTTQIRLHELAYNDGLQTLSETTSTLVDPVPTSSPNVSGLGRINGELIAVLTPGSSGNPVAVSLADGSQVWTDTLQPLSSFQTATPAVFESGPYAYTVEGVQSGLSVYLAKRWPKTTTYNFAGRVLDSAEACFDGLFKPVPPGYTEAAVTAVNVGGHRFRLSGEIIKASLELFFGGEVVPEYLDAIYGIEIQDTASLPRWFKQYSGNESFQRAGQADDYSVLVPGTLRLFVDSTFWSIKA